LGALNGVYRITTQYIKVGNKFRKENEYQRAVLFYRKAIRLRPNDKEILKEIKFCENKIQNNNLATDISTTSAFEKGISLNMSKTQSINKINTKENFKSTDNVPNWIIEGLSEDDFQFGSNDVTLKASSKVKKILSGKPYYDIDYEVNVQPNNNNEEGKVGLIVGHSIDKGIDTETYFLISIEQSGNLKLHEFSNGSKKQLFSIPLDLSESTDFIIYKLKLKCLGPWIMIYNNQKLLKAWYNEKLIRGKVGLFADQNTYVHFTKIKISNIIHTENKNIQFQSNANL
jgi:hypothetical protein